MFALSHLCQTLKTFALIGNNSNLYVMNSLQKAGFSIFDFVFIPTDVLKKASLNQEILAPQNTSLIFTNSGYNVK